MPRLAYETPCRPVRERTDRTLAVVKLGTFVVAVGLVGAIYLLSDGGRSREVGQPTAAVSAVPTSTTAPVVVAPPMESTVTSEMVPVPQAPRSSAQSPLPPAPVPEPAPESTRPSEPPRRDPRFAVAGEPCPRPGMYSMTERYQPVVCRRGSWDLVPVR